MNVSISGKHDDDTWESRIPSAYRAGYKKASALNPELAAKYIQHTVVDAPVADAVIEALAAFDHRESQRFINAGMEQDARLIRDAERLGANLTADARVGIMQIWRYASWLIGTPEALLFDGDEFALLLDATVLDHLRCRSTDQ